LSSSLSSLSSSLSHVLSWSIRTNILSLPCMHGQVMHARASNGDYRNRKRFVLSCVDIVR
jgi:predicted component of type VI protein secretion system